MSYIYALAEGAEFSGECFSDIEPFVRSNLNPTEEKSYSNGNTTESFPLSQSGITSKLSAEPTGEGSAMLCAADSLAKTSALREPGQASKEHGADYGSTSPEWFAKLDRDSGYWKIRQLLLFEDLEPSLEIWPRWGMMRDGECSALEIPEGCTNAIASGYFSLPTIGKNEWRGASRKRFRGSLHFRGAKMSEGLRTCEADMQYTAVHCAEDQMDWPIMWSALQPLAILNVQAWLRSHGEPFQAA